MPVAVIAYRFCFVPARVVHDERQFGVFCVHAFYEFEELFRVKFVAEHVMIFVIALCAVTVEVLAHVRKLLYGFGSFFEPTVRNFWLNAKGCLIQNKERIALGYALGNQASEFFLKRFCAALSAL